MGGSNLTHFYHMEDLNTLWESIDGFFHRPEVEMLRTLIQLYPEGKYVEVGSWLGKSIISVLPSLVENKYEQIVCVDTWLGSDNEIYESDGTPGPHYEARQRDIFEDFKTNLGKTGLNEYVEVYRMPSVEASTHFEDNTLDIVFLDGNHTFEEVDKDIIAWCPKVKQMGYLCGHDISFKAVYAAVNINFRPGAWFITNNCWAYRKLDG